MLSNQIITRIAPTPSGFLHLGNVYNFLLTTALAKNSKGRCFLRIDDFDQTRVRDEYIADILWLTEFLGLPLEAPPGSVEDFHQNFSQKQFFAEILNIVSAAKACFSCSCSRKEILQNSNTGIYPKTCYGNTKIIFDQRYCIRHKTKFHKKDFKCIVKNQEYIFSNNLHDIVVWSKDQFPSYQLINVLHDEHLKVNTIIRGKDLIESTVIQNYLSKQLNFSDFLKIEFYHHKILLNKDQSKLSKSQGENTSLKEVYTNSSQIIKASCSLAGFKRAIFSFQEFCEYLEEFPEIIGNKLNVEFEEG